MKLPGRLMSRAMVTPSLITSGYPTSRISTTFRPRGPSVTCAGIGGCWCVGVGVLVLGGGEWRVVCQSVSQSVSQSAVDWDKDTVAFVRARQSVDQASQPSKEEKAARSLGCGRGGPPTTDDRRSNSHTNKQTNIHTYIHTHLHHIRHRVDPANQLLRRLVPVVDDLGRDLGHRHHLPPAPPRRPPPRLLLLRFSPSRVQGVACGMCECDIKRRGW